MKVGDLVFLKGTMWSSWKNQGKIGIVVEAPTNHQEGGLDIMFDTEDNINDYSGYEEHLEVINESR